VQISPLISVNREGLPTNRILKALSQGDAFAAATGKVRLGITSPGSSPVSAETSLTYSQATPLLRIHT